MIFVKMNVLIIQCLCIGWDTLDANIELGHAEDARTYEVAVEILRDLGITQVKLLTNNPKKIQALNEAGISVTERIEIRPEHWNDARPTEKEVDTYLVTKVKRMNHLLTLPDRLNEEAEIEDTSTDYSSIS